MAEPVGSIEEVILSGEFDHDEIVIRFRDKKGKMTKKVLVVDHSGTIHVHEDEADYSTRSIQPFKKAIKTVA